MIIRLFISTFL